MQCSICNKEIPDIMGWDESYNAQPVNDGRCCDRCHYWFVVMPARTFPARISMPIKEENKHVS